MGYTRIIKGRLTCEKCGRTLIRLLLPTQIEEIWKCPKHGKVTKAIHHFNQN